MADHERVRARLHDGLMPVISADPIVVPANPLDNLYDFAGLADLSYLPGFDKNAITECGLHCAPTSTAATIFGRGGRAQPWLCPSTC
jgi:hypothetical protein